jgi:predicted TIM-barrel fold metal-dependent hydrolase
LSFENVQKTDAERIFNFLLTSKNRPGLGDIRALEDFVMHYLCLKCGEHGIRMKFHTGLQEGNGNVITNSRAALMANLFTSYPQTGFDIYHISYPYQDELVTIAKNFPNVTVNFCWMWIINPAAARRALSEMLDAVPANKIHGFGGDFSFVEGSYGHAKIARREISRVLAEKVGEHRFSEDYAICIGHMLLRDNALDNFGLAARRVNIH